MCKIGIRCPKCGNCKVNSMSFKINYDNTYYEFYCSDCDTYFIMKSGFHFVRYGKINDSE